MSSLEMTGSISLVLAVHVVLSLFQFDFLNPTPFKSSVFQNLAQRATSIFFILPGMYRPGVCSVLTFSSQAYIHPLILLGHPY